MPPCKQSNIVVSCQLFCVRPTSVTEPSGQLDPELEQSEDGPHTAELVIQPFQTVAEDTVIWSVGYKCSVNFPLTVL